MSEEERAADGGADNSTGNDPVAEELASLKQDYNQLLSQFNAMQARLSTPQRSTVMSARRLPPRQSEHNVAQNEVYVRREFNIVGQIGKPGDKDKLSFGSLAHQIEAGVAKKYTDKEILAAVIRAVSAGTTLRSFLEGKSTDLTLQTLRKFLRFHFHEKDATALYKDLINLTQNQSETNEEFLMRSLDLCQKVMFASKEAESGVQYDAALVGSMMRQSVLTGLCNQNVKMEVRSVFLDPSSTDEALMEAIFKASQLEAERMRRWVSPVQNQRSMCNRWI